MENAGLLVNDQNKRVYGTAASASVNSPQQPNRRRKNAGAGSGFCCCIMLCCPKLKVGAAPVRTYNDFATDEQHAELKKLRAASAVRFDADRHWPLMERLWTAVRKAGGVDADDDVPPPRDQRWKAVGFQSETPATDFRGGGVLALEHLLHLAERRPDACRAMGCLASDIFLKVGVGAGAGGAGGAVVDASAGPPEAYPWAVCGINVSHVLVCRLQLAAPDVARVCPVPAPSGRAANRREDLRGFAALAAATEGGGDAVLAELFCLAMGVMDARYRRVAREHGARAIMHFQEPLAAAWEAARGWLAEQPENVAALRARGEAWLSAEREKFSREVASSG